jgi:hypothetical protein
LHNTKWSNRKKKGYTPQKNNSIEDSKGNEENG